MKFIVDAHLPPRLVLYLREKGFDTIHTRELPESNLTEDKEVIRISMLEERVVISKDNDFYDAFILFGQPHNLLMITTGNIVNRDLIALFDRNWPKIVALLSKNRVVELGTHHLSVHF